MGEFRLDEAIEILERTPHVLRAWLDGLGPHWTHRDYGEGTFTVFDVVGHLIHGEKADWLARTRIILEQGPDRPFDKYDRYAQFEDSRGKTLVQLLDEFERLRAANLVALRELRLTGEQLAKPGTHPALGRVTLKNLLATWAAHDLNHIAQIAKAMATQYADSVGPWREYLSILKSKPTPMDADGIRRAKAARAAAG
ncbi:MAG: DinB family protein [Phycisphaerae bacterium]|nr:DinB family protein [Phycisphaerae bacterium]